MEVPAHQDNDFGDLLHQYRLRARLTQEELAERSGLSVRAIADMQVRGAPLIGVTAAWGLALAMRADPTDTALAEACRRLFP